MKTTSLLLIIKFIQEVNEGSEHHLSLTSCSHLG